MDDMTTLPRVELGRTGKVHYVFAGGGPADGSLHDFYTLCGQPIQGDTGDATNAWRETNAEPTCGRCLRIVRPVAVAGGPDLREAAQEPCPECGGASVRYCRTCRQPQDTCNHSGNYERRALVPNLDAATQSIAAENAFAAARAVDGVGAQPVPTAPHSEAIGDEDIVALVHRLGWDDGMVSIDEIATVRAWLQEQDDKVAL